MTSPAAAEILRGTMRLLLDLDLTSLPEFTLATGRRVDLMALGRDGRLVAIEVKSCRTDFLTDRKWRDYLGYADQFYFAVGAGLPGRAAAARGGADRGRPLRREPDPAGPGARGGRRPPARAAAALRAHGRPAAAGCGRPGGRGRARPRGRSGSIALRQPLLDQEAGDAVRVGQPHRAPVRVGELGAAEPAARPRSRRRRASARCRGPWRGSPASATAGTARAARRGRRARRPRRPPPRSTSRRSVCSSDSPGSTKPARVEYMPGGNRGERPSRHRSPWVTSTITAGSVRGNVSRPQAGQRRAWPPWAGAVAPPQQPQNRWPRCQCASARA